MSCWALIALKAPSSAKGRLADILALDERRLLVEHMFTRVLAALRATPVIAGIAVVTNEVLTHADVLTIADPGGGLNAALSHGAQALARCGVSHVLILHADLPLLGATDLNALIALGRRHGQAIAPDKTGLGSNALYLPLPLPIPLCFGSDSQRLHQAAASAHGLVLPTLNRPGLAQDIDERQDLQQLLASGAADWQFLAPALQQGQVSR